MRNQWPRVLAVLLEHSLRELDPSSQAVYLRLAWWAGLRSGEVAATTDRLVVATGLTRNTVRQALRRLGERGLIRVVSRTRRHPTLWWVSVPELPPVTMPRPLEAHTATREWLADRLEPDDLAALEALRDQLGPAALAELEEEAVRTYGKLPPGETEKAVAELLIRKYFGPSRLAKYR